MDEIVLMSSIFITVLAIINIITLLYILIYDKIDLDEEGYEILGVWISSRYYLIVSTVILLILLIITKYLINK